MAARAAADELGLMFVATGKDAFKLSLAREAEELEAVGEGRRVIDAERAIKTHLEVAAMHQACLAIRQLTEQNPDFLAGKVDGVKWAGRDQETGFFAAKPSVARLGEALPTALLPPLQVSASVVVYGTGNATGIVWPRSVLFREVPHELSGIGDYSFSSNMSSWLKSGPQTIEEALVHMGFLGPQRRPVMEIFAPVPAPLKGARLEEQFVPRGLVELKSSERGKYSLITIIESKAQNDVIGIDGGDTAHIMGDQEMIGGAKQRTFLKFEYVPMMTGEREAETRSPQRGNIVVIAVPVITMPSFKDLRPSFDGPDLFGGGGMRGGSFGFKSLGAELGSAHVEADHSTATGATLGESESVTIDHSRHCGIFRIVPIGVSADVEVPKFEATVINLADHRKKTAG